MKRKLKRLIIKEPILIDNFKVSTSANAKTELIKYDDESVTVVYTTLSGEIYESEPFPSKYSKLIWQKAQQQQ
jgi:hypothetical protein